MFKIKLTAFLIHFTISLSLFITFLAIALFIWYPSFYFGANGVIAAIYTVAFVDVGLGPVLTFVLYKPGKPGLKFDMSMIIVFQLAALMWATWLLYSERPVLTVYHADYFYCLSQSTAQAANANVSQFPANDLIPLAYLPLAKTPEEIAERDAIINKTSHERNSPVLPMFVFGDKFKAISQENLSEILYDELDIMRAVDSKPEYEKMWEQFKQKHPQQAHFAFFPLICSPTEYLVAMDRQTGMLIDGMPIPSLNTIKKRLLTTPKSEQ